MNKYVIKSKDNVLEEYVVLVVGNVNFLDHDVTYGLSSTDNPEDATNFTFISEALYAMETLSLHEDDWEVVEA